MMKSNSRSWCRLLLKKGLLLASVFALHTSANAACFQLGTIIRVFAVDDASGPTHAINFRTSALADHYYRAVTQDDNMIEIATILMVNQAPVAITGSISVCPTVGTVREIGQLLSLNSQ